VYLHGWKENRRSNLHKSLFTTPAVIFDFPDARRNGKVSLRHAGFGQKTDMLPTVFVLNAIVESGLACEINLVGFSRGGAVAVNTVAMLNKPQRYRQDLAKLYINSEQCHKILQALTPGIIVLDCPLKYVGHSIMQQVQNYRASFIDATSERICSMSLLQKIKKHLVGSIDHICYNLLEYVIFPIYTHYTPWAEQPVYTVEDWPKASLTTIIRYDSHDQMVSNIGDIPFYQKISSKNPLRTFLITSNQCGHCSRCQELCDLFATLSNPSPIHVLDLMHLTLQAPFFGKPLC
jgi:hypothetical protein